MQDDKPISWGAGAKVVAILLGGILAGRQVASLEKTDVNQREYADRVSQNIDRLVTAVEAMRTLVQDVRLEQVRLSGKQEALDTRVLSLERKAGAEHPK